MSNFTLDVEFHDFLGVPLCQSEIFLRFGKIEINLMTFTLNGFVVICFNVIEFNFSVSFDA